MSYIGSTPTTQSFIAGTDYFNGTGSQTAFTLSRSVVSANDIQATVNNVVQQPNDAYTVSGNTITFTSAPSAGTNNVYVRYISTTTQSIAPSQGTVGWAQLNSDTQQDLGISFKNKIINGAMTIAQRGTSFSGITVSNTDGWPADRFRLRNSDSVSVLTVSNVADAPAGFVNSAKAEVTTINATPNNETFIEQVIEGNNLLGFGYGTSSAQSFTLSFWVKASVVGTYNVWFLNAAPSKAAGATYTVTVANTWQKVSMTIAGDTAAAIASNNSAGIYVRWYLDIGAPGIGPLNAVWSASNVGNRMVSGSVRLCSTLGATFYLTGVQLEVGTQATTFDNRSIGTELLLCQRYYEVITGNAETYTLQLYATNNFSNFRGHWFPKVTKRAAPTFAILSGTSWGGSTPNIYPTIDDVNMYSGGFTFLNCVNGSPAASLTAEL
jgi:hypothetical protein